jgi:hypothetical protein
MATFNILTAHTGTGTQQTMAGGDSLFLAHSGTLNSLGADGAKSTGGDNDLQIHGTLAGGNSAFFGADGGDLIQIYSDATVLGGVVSAITVDGTGDNAFMNAGAISTHTTQADTTVIDIEGDNNSFTNTGSITANQFGAAVYIDGGSNTFNNQGSITAGTDGTNFASGSAVDIESGGANATHLQSIVNSGSMTALHGDGLFVDGGDNDLSNTSSGVISASGSGVEIGGGHNMVTNAGSITGGVGVTPGSDQTGLYMSSGSDTVHNSGAISGNFGVAIQDGSNTITNAAHAHITGTLDDGLYVDGGGNTINNDGTIVGVAGGIVLDGGSNTLTNSRNGHITGQGFDNDAVFIDDGSNTITNRGHITGGIDGQGVYMDDGSNTIVNSKGAVISDSLDNSTNVANHYTLFASDGHNTLSNDGTIAMHMGDGDDFDNLAVYLDGGDNSVTNGHSGVITDGDAASVAENWAIYLEGGNNTVTNHGHITGTVVIGNDSDSDSFNGGNGHFNGTILGGNGNDAIEVGKGTSTIFGGDGADFLQAGAGHHSFNYTDVDNSYGSGASNFDTVDDFNAAKDSFSFDFNSGSFDSADFKTINGAALTDSNFDADLKADIGGQLHANSAVLLHISGGEFAGDSFLVVDGNGHAGYQAGSDYVVELTNLNGTVTAADIHAMST